MCTARWSFKKRFGFGPLTHKDFVELASQFGTILGAYQKSPPRFRITLFRDVPWSVTAPEAGVLEFVAAENKKKELAEFIETGKLPDIPKELFDLAEYVRLFVFSAEANNESNPLYGWMECKGLLLRHAVFGVVPAPSLKYYGMPPEDISDAIKSLCTKNHRPSSFRFAIGDGYENCTSVSLS